MRDRFSGAVMAYLQNERNEQANFESLRHFAGRYLLDKKGVLLVLELAGFQIHQFQVFGLTTRAVRERERSGHWRNWQDRLTLPQVSIGSFGCCGLTSLPKPGHSMACVQYYVMSETQRRPS